VWSNNFTFKESYATYSGCVDDNDFHHHAITQIVISTGQPVKLYSDKSTLQIAKGFIIPPLLMHKIECLSAVEMVYLEPIFATKLQNPNSRAVAPLEFLSDSLMSLLKHEQDPRLLLKQLALNQAHTSSSLDARLVLVFDFLKADPANHSISAAAKLIGLSEPRLRSLVRDQVGVPLVTWLLWRKLHKSINALIQGANLIDAAIDGGFSDQAHFNRTMKRMLGITPRMAAKIVSQE